MKDKMGVDIDGVDRSCLNIAKSNVVHYKLDGKMDYVGGLIKKDTPNYIKNFIYDNITTLMDGKGYEFLDAYFKYVKKIVNCELKGFDISSKVKFKGLLAYETENKNKSAPYELVKAKGLEVEAGSQFYYYNIGKKIDTPDFTYAKYGLGKFNITNYGQERLDMLLELITNPEKRMVLKKFIEEEYLTQGFTYNKTRREIILEDGTTVLKLIPNMNLLENFDEWDLVYEINESTTKKGTNKYLQITCKQEQMNVCELPLDDKLALVQYNVPKYLNSFVKAVSPLFLAFNEEVRKHLYVTVDQDDYATPMMSEESFELVSGIPLADKMDNQQDKEQTMVFDPIEMRYWTEVKQSPFWFLDSISFDQDKYVIKSGGQFFCELNNIGRVQMESFKTKIYV
jgi:hypothetical protein